MCLGITEAAGIPSSSKASATYLKPAEVSLGNAVQSVDITLGAIFAPLVVAAVMPFFGWRAVFVVCGALGLLWASLWWIISRSIPSTRPNSAPTFAVAEILRDTRLWSVIVGSTLVMTVYSLWMNWTTIYLVQEHHLTQLQANQYFAWIPPIFASLGGLAGGWWALRLVRNGESAVTGRLRACLTGAPILAVTAIVPFLPSVQLAIAGICISFFGCMLVVINLHVIPIDLFGVKRAAFSASLLTASFALVQIFLSPAIGAIIDRSNFAVVCTLLSALSIAGVTIVKVSIK
jgi:ACS family hexuronate transporter-like MFS transporter